MHRLRDMDITPKMAAPTVGLTNHPTNQPTNMSPTLV